MTVVVMKGPNGLAASANRVELVDGQIVVEFDAVPDGFYTRLYVDGAGVNGFRTGFRKGPYRASIGMAPTILEQS